MKRPLIFRNRDFLLLWISQSLSQVGHRMFQIAVAWWILSNVKENSGTFLALFMVMGSLPAILFVKVIGVIIDRNKSKRVLITNDILGSILALSLALVISHNDLHIGLVLLSGLLFAMFHGFIEPTLNKAVPELVKDEDVSSAVAFLSSTQTLANFTGALLGALLIDRVGLLGVVLLCGLTYLISFFLDSAINFRPKIIREAKEKEDKTQVSGWAILNDMPLVRKILITFGCINFFGTPILVILPIYTKFVLKASATVLGSLEAAIWLGILSGTFLSRYLGGKEAPLKFVGFCLLGFGAFLAMPALFIDRYFYGVCLLGAGFSLGAMNVRMISLFQFIIPDSLKGRFFALLQALVSFAVPIGYLGFASLSDVVPVQVLCLMQGSGVVTLASLFLFYSREQSTLEEYKLRRSKELAV